ncbi:MAG: hypothetical protein WC862_02850 [Patescibacteria group bacterium]
MKRFDNNIYAKAPGDRTTEEQRMLDDWEEQRSAGKFRNAFPEIADMLARGEVDEGDIIDIDPTPLVAGGSLIPASRTSLLTEEEFRAVLRGFEVK